MDGAFRKGTGLWDDFETGPFGDAVGDGLRPKAATQISLRV